MNFRKLDELRVGQKKMGSTNLTGGGQTWRRRQEVKVDHHWTNCWTNYAWQSDSRTLLDQVFGQYVLRNLWLQKGHCLDSRIS